MSSLFDDSVFDPQDFDRGIYQYFNEAEMQRCSPPCHLKDMDNDFMHRLDALRARCGFPLPLTSAYRSVQHDLAKGRSGKGWHTKGRAVDIYCNDSSRRALIVKFALELGFNGIGIGSHFVHLDDRETPTMWHYYPS